MSDSSERAPWPEIDGLVRVDWTGQSVTVIVDASRLWIGNATQIREVVSEHIRVSVLAVVMIQEVLERAERARGLVAPLAFYDFPGLLGAATEAQDALTVNAAEVIRTLPGPSGADRLQ